MKIVVYPYMSHPTTRGGGRRFTIACTEVAFRYGSGPGYRNDYFGFRVIWEVR